MTASIQDQLRALGRDFTLEQIQATQALYAPIVPRPTTEICMVERDCAYGSDPRQRLDVFTPARDAAGLPVVAFVHGGGFVQGDKGGPKDVFHNHFGAWAARNSFVGVTITYRLAPDHQWPSGAEDIAAAVAWLRENVARFGGDPDRIVIIGQSAGGTHVASYLSHPETRDAAAASLAGAVLCSGVYDVERAERTVPNAAYFGEDPSRYAGMSTLDGLAATPVRLALTVSELEPSWFQTQAAWAVERIVVAKGRWPAFFWLGGHNHVSPVLQIGSPHDDLGPRLASLIARLDAWS